jgi:hypothetical protein
MQLVDASIARRRKRGLWVSLTVSCALLVAGWVVSKRPWTSTFFSLSVIAAVVSLVVAQWHERPWRSRAWLLLVVPTAAFAVASFWAYLDLMLLALFWWFAGGMWLKRRDRSRRREADEANGKVA